MPASRGSEAESRNAVVVANRGASGEGRTRALSSPGQTGRRWGIAESPVRLCCSAAELDHVAAGEGHALGEHGGAAAGEVPSGVLLVVGLFRRHAVDRYDGRVAALDRTVAGAHDRALGGGAGDDHGLDALRLESLVE